MDEHIQQSPLELTQRQKQLADSIVDNFSVAKSRKLVLLTGYSGVGKTLLAEHIQETNPDLDISVSQKEDLLLKTYTSGWNSHFLVTTKPPLFEDDSVLTKIIQEATVNGLEIETVILEGMTDVELRSLLGRGYIGKEAALDRELIIKYSLGVPSLARMLSVDGLSEELAVSIAARYLGQNTRDVSQMNKYLNMEVPSEVLDEVLRIDSTPSVRRIYDGLSYSLAKWARLADSGIFHEPPVFIAPESVQIYDLMLNSNQSPNIDIFVPDLTDIDFERISKVIGIDATNSGIGSRESRSHMFQMEWRKVSIWERNSVGHTGVKDNEHYEVVSTVEKYIQAHQQGKLGIAGQPVRGSDFWIHAHAHWGEQNQIQVGYMVETLLQQLGVAYFVRNKMIDRDYRYDPVSKRIVFFDSPIKLPNHFAN